MEFKKGSLSLVSAVSMGTGVMIGAGIFALTGQVAEFAGPFFPLAFFLAALVSLFSAYSYIRVSKKYPSSGGIAMILKKAYGKNTITAGAAMLMVFSMILNEALVARTFGTYSLHLFDMADVYWLVSLMAVGLIIFSFVVNIVQNKVISNISKVAAIVKISGITVFAGAAIYAAGFNFQPVSSGSGVDSTVLGVVAGTALAILAYKGFTTITNSGEELNKPEKNLSRAILVSLGICLSVYMLVSYGVGSNLTIPEIVNAKNYSLAEAARPSLGTYGVWFTVGIALVATSSGILGSMFSVSRTMTMLTEMKLIPHSHFKMPGDIHKHILVYITVIAGLLAAFFDLSRIAAIGIIFYLVMDIIIHWGVFRHLRKDVGANPIILIVAMVLDAIALATFMVLKGFDDPTIIAISLFGVVAVFAFEKFYLEKRSEKSGDANTL